MWQKWVALALAGACGTLARYALAGAVQRAAEHEFPWGTLTVNIIGCFLAGAMWSFAEGHVRVMTSDLRSVVLIGFMGAFTTFSAYILDTGNLARDGQVAWAVGNMALQNGVGVAALFLGLVVGRLI